MSDKMITPEEYLRDNPTALIFRHEISKAGQSTAMTRPGNGEGWKYSEADILIDWTGYTEPHVMIGPEFPQSRKREVKWDKWRITQDKVNKGDLPFQRVELPDGGTCFRIGKYIDKPVKSKPELSRFLPDGWEWQITTGGYINAITPDREYLRMAITDGDLYQWHKHNILHPSEGGGFQKHKPGDPMPCDGDLSVDVLWDNHQSMTTLRYAKSGYWEDLSSSDNINGWRPHYKEQI
jgi:hypothetical protein